MTSVESGNVLYVQYLTLRQIHIENVVFFVIGYFISIGMNGIFGAAVTTFVGASL